MLDINPLTNNQIFLKKIAENTGSDYETGDVSEINPLTIDQILLKEIAANTAGQSGDITELEEKVADNTAAIEAIVNVTGAKNILPITLEGLKANNTSGTWNDNAFTDYGVTFTIYTNNAGFVTSVSATGTATLGNERLYIARNATDLNKYSGMILSGSDDSGDCGILIGNSQSTYAECKGEDTTIGNIPANEQNTLWLNIYPQKTVSGAVFTPMIRPAGTDSEFVVGSMTNRELTEKVDRGSVSVTADGVKTYSQLFDELSILAEHTKIKKESQIYLNNRYWKLSFTDSGYYLFSNTMAMSGEIYIGSIHLLSNLSTFDTWILNSSGNSHTSLGSEVPPSGKVITLYY